ncbi:DMP19 family protein [Polaromonas sp. LjRoot131]|uniref:DMP19 family protein n=1 Tax=Polaromonas sp. LjRoot131 TaxID=3342262 RepID=UPI003ECFF20C
MTIRLPCKSCGESIHPDTAAKNNGLCMPCMGGYRKDIEAGKKRREQERIYDQSAERKHWVALVKRVHDVPNGFEKLMPPEKTYFSVSVLIGEVYNGGFDQFFSNSSGALYAYALDGLFEMEAEESAAQLVKAKQILFGDARISLDKGERLTQMSHSGFGVDLNDLDKAFCEDQENLGARCKRYAIIHSLYEDD